MKKDELMWMQLFQKGTRLNYQIYPMMLIGLLTAIHSLKVLEFGDEAIELCFKEDAEYTAVLLLQPEENTQILQTFKSTGESISEDKFVFIHMLPANDYYDRVKEFTGKGDTETVIILHTSTRSRYELEGGISAQSLQKFIADFKDGKLTKYFKSESNDETPQGESVKKLIGKNFQETVLRSNKEFLIMVYAPWCGHCKAIKPTYERLARSLVNNKNIVIAKLDGTLNEVDELPVEGFPTLFWFKKGATEKTSIKYEGGRDLEEFQSWLKENTQFDWVEPVEVQQIEEAEPKDEDL